MDDRDSYGLYCSIVLQGYRQYGGEYTATDISVVDACARYLTYINKHHASPAEVFESNRLTSV